LTPSPARISWLLSLTSVYIIRWRRTRVEYNRLYRGDCVAGLERLPPGWADLVFADPPFNIGYEYDVYDDRREAEQYLSWTKRSGWYVRRAVKPRGALC